MFYPGSVERTSFAERDDAKGSLILELEGDVSRGGRVVGYEFRELPTRPMFSVSVDASDVTPDELERRIRGVFSDLPDDAVVGLRNEGELPPSTKRVVRSERLRALHPPSMTVTVGEWHSRQDRNDT